MLLLTLYSHFVITLSLCLLRIQSFPAAREHRPIAGHHWGGWHKRSRFGRLHVTSHKYRVPSTCSGRCTRHSRVLILYAEGLSVDSTGPLLFERHRISKGSEGGTQKWLPRIS